MAALLEEVGDSGAAGDGLLRLRHLVEEQEVAPLPGVRVVGVRVIRDGGRVTRDGANGRAGRNTNTNINNSNLKAQAKFESANAHRLQHHHHGPPIAPTPPTPTSTPPSPTMAPQQRGKKQSPRPHQAAVELQDGGHVAAAVAVVGRGPHRHQVLPRRKGGGFNVLEERAGAKDNLLIFLSLLLPVAAVADHAVMRGANKGASERTSAALLFHFYFLLARGGHFVQARGGHIV